MQVVGEYVIINRKFQRKGVALMATIHDVARAAGVSSATVSRVMNNAACVLPQTQRRVEEAIRALNYQPNQFSRNLRLGESRMLLVLAPNLQNTFYGDMLEAMDECAQQNGYNLLIVSTHMDRQRETRLCDFLHNRQADGALFMSAAQSPEQITALSETYPVVQVCALTTIRPSATWFRGSSLWVIAA